ncbi:MAG: hypothetical protein AAB739_00780, partial [Patescibacteria group bacterium]
MKKLSMALLIALIVTPIVAFAQFGPPAGFENMTGPPAGYSGTMGPPANLEELMQKGQEMGNKGLQRLKSSTKSMQKAITQMQKAVKKVTDAGYGIPAGVEDSLAKAIAAIDTINNATEFTDTAQTAMDDFNDFVDLLDTNMENMQMLGAFPRIKKQADREVANLQKAFDKVKSKLANVEFDLTGEFADVQAQVDAVKANYDKAIAAAQAGDPQSAFDILENDFFPAIGDTRQTIGMLDAVKNLTRASKQVAAGIKSAEKIVAKLDKKGIDTSKLKDIIAQSNAQLDAFNAALKIKPFDPADAVDYLDTLNGLREDFENEVENQLTDNEELGSTIKPVKFFNAQMPTVPKEIRNGFPQGGANDFGGLEKL